MFVGWARRPPCNIRQFYGYAQGPQYPNSVRFDQLQRRVSAHTAYPAQIFRIDTVITLRQGGGFVAIPSMNETVSESLRVLTDDKHHMRNGILKRIYTKFRTSAEEQAKKTAGGTKVVESRLAWAIYHLKMAELIEVGPTKELTITKKGKEWATTYGEFKLGDLKKIKVYREWWNKVTGPKPPDPEPPEEELGRVLQRYKTSQIDDVRERLKDVDAFHFEVIVMDLLEKMGYGRAKVTKKSHDGGIDGEVTADKLGIGKIYMQAKRWRTNVGPKDVGYFVSTVSRKKSKQGVFITTSDFTSEARKVAENPGANIVLVNGEVLLENMYEHGIGFMSEKRAEIKSVDKNYFPD